MSVIRLVEDKVRGRVVARSVKDKVRKRPVARSEEGL